MTSIVSSDSSAGLVARFPSVCACMAYSDTDCRIWVCLSNSLLPQRNRLPRAHPNRHLDLLAQRLGRIFHLQMRAIVAHLEYFGCGRHATLVSLTQVEVDYDLHRL